MDNLRLILIVAGLLVLALMVLFHRPSGGRRSSAKRRGRARIEPALEGQERPAAEREDDATERSTAPTQPSFSALDEIPPDGAAGIDPVGQKAPPGEQRIEPRLTAAGEPPVCDETVTLYLRARHDRLISGLSLLDAALKAGLTFGEMNIFHRRHEGASKPVFSMANLTPPGHFDPKGWNLFETPGLTLFMTLPGPVSALDAWDALLATGRRLAELLQADLIDASHQPIGRLQIAEIREHLRKYDRSHGDPA